MLRPILLPYRTTAGRMRFAGSKGSRLPAMLLAGAVLSLAAQGAQAADDGPSFDCKAARTAPEKMICADPALAALDRRISAAYQKAMSGLDPKARMALRDDQRFFLQARDVKVEMKDPDYDFKADLASRATVLEGIDPVPRPGWLGTWANTSGEITLTSGKGGTFTLHINTVQPYPSYPVCDLSAVGRLSGETMMVGTSKAERAENEGWTVRLTRKGAALSAELVRPKGESQGSPPFCGFRASIDGTFMPVKAGTDNAPLPKP